jgi:hypothetical protein
LDNRYPSLFSVFVSLFFLLLLTPPLHAGFPQAGTDFWVAFPFLVRSSSTLELVIAGRSNTTGQVQIPGLSFTANFSIPAGGTTFVSIPSAARIADSDVPSNLGIHVTAQDSVALYGLNQCIYASEGFLGLPTAALGQNYFLQSYTNITAGDVAVATGFLVVGVANGTSVTITPSFTTGTRPVGIPYTVLLDQGNTYALMNPTGDLSGSIISSDQPVAVLGFNQCTVVPHTSLSCNPLIEQLWPVSVWGTEFYSVPLATRALGDTFRFLAATDGTVVDVNGNPVAVLNRGQYFETVLTTLSQITSTHPIQVMQYSNSQFFDNHSSSDPFMMTLPPVTDWGNQYLVGQEDPQFINLYPTTGNYENIVVPNNAVGSILLDGAALPSASFSQIGSSGYSGGALTVTGLTHYLTGPVSFSVLAYSYGTADGYGFPAALYDATIQPTFTSTPSSTPTPTPTPSSTATTTSTPSVTLTATATVTATDTPTATVTQTPTPSATPLGPLRLWPNPFNPATAVRGTLKCADMPEGSSLAIFTLSGENVFEAVEKGYLVEWNGKTNKGTQAAPGIYYCVVRKNQNMLLKTVLVVSSF